MFSLPDTADSPAASLDCVEGLTQEQSQRLSDLLDAYLSSLEGGDRLDLSALASLHPDLAATLRAYVNHLDLLFGMAGNVQPASGQPERLGDFRILQPIGHGGMGIVYEAEQISLGRRVALKLLPLASGFDDRQIQRFKNESRAAAHLNHPHIVPVYAVGEQAGIHYYAMQFIDGYPLDEVIRCAREGPSCSPHESGEQTVPRLDWQAAVQHIVHAAAALHHAHQNGIVHRDIKPSNLLLDRADKIWITDFGLARSQHNQSLTCSGDLVGTMRYMSPEQALGRSEWVDHRTDVYSLGATLYELLSLQPAMLGDHTAELLQAIENSQPVSLRKLRPDLPADLSVVLSKAMAKRRDDRYETALQFSQDLTAVLEQRPTLAQPLAWSTLVARWMNAHRPLVGWAAVAILFAWIGLAISSARIAHQEQLAHHNAELAQHYFRQAHAAVEQLGSQFADDLVSLPGSRAEQIRKRLLQQTLVYYQNFVQDAKDNPQLSSDLAATHNRIGGLLTDMESPAAALPYFEAAAELYARLDEDNQVDAAMPRLRAGNLNQLGVTYAALGRPQDAWDCYALAESLLRTAFSQQTPADSLWSELTTEILLTLGNQATVRAQLEPPAAAEPYLLRVVADLEDHIAEHPQDVLAQRGLSALLVSLSELASAGSPLRAAKFLERALDGQLACLDKTQPAYRSTQEIVATYNRLGTAYAGQQRWDAAATAFSQAVRLDRQLCLLYPESLECRSNLSVSLNNLASAHTQRRDLVSAQLLAVEAVTLSQQVASAAPQAAISHQRLAAAASNLAIVLSAGDAADESVQYLQQAISSQRQAVALEPDNHQQQVSLSLYCGKLLKTFIHQAQWEQALPAAESYLRESLADAECKQTAQQSLLKAMELFPFKEQRQSIRHMLETQHRRG